MNQGRSNWVVLFTFFVSYSLLFSFSAICDAGTLFDWNSGTGTTLQGWTWHNDVAYGNPGWTKDLGRNYTWGYGPRSMQKGDYGNLTQAEVDTTDRAPSTSIGGCLKLTEKPGSAHLCSWWPMYDGQNLGSQAVADSTTNRWSFYLKTSGMSTLSEDGGNESIPSANFHIGTYICWNDGRTVYGQGDGCPYEGPGNQHYYHYLTINPGTWIHVVLDNHPSHRRDSYVSGNDPTYLESGKHYLEHLHQFYTEIRYVQPQTTTMKLDEMSFYTETEPQNENSITSVWVGYWPTTDNWEIGWQDMSWSTRGDNTHSTFDIRWSTAPITNANFGSANRITPLFYGGTAKCGTGGEQLVRRPNAWATVAWTRFKLPDNIEASSNHIYFAVKDVSVTGAHVGTQWPWNRGDGHNAPTSNIRTIDYHLGPASVPQEPQSPNNLRVVN